MATRALKHDGNIFSVGMKYEVRKGQTDRLIKPIPWKVKGSIMFFFTPRLGQFRRELQDFRWALWCKCKTLGWTGLVFLLLQIPKPLTIGGPYGKLPYGTFTLRERDMSLNFLRAPFLYFVRALKFLWNSRIKPVFFSGFFHYVPLQLLSYVSTRESFYNT